MKKWFAYGAIFLSSYIAFLLANAPLSLVFNYITLPKNIVIQGVSGSVWQGEISQLTINNNTIEQVKTEVSFWSLFTLAPRIQVNFGNAMVAGPEGKFTLKASTEKALLTEVELFLSANDIAKQLPLPIPVSAQGNVELYLPSIEFSIDKKVSCLQAKGDVTWLRAGVVALDNNITLGKLSADIRCTKGDLQAKVNPKNNLGLSYDVVFSSQSQRLSGQGYLKPGAKFPTELKSALPFLGRVDNQGGYRLRF